MDPATLFGLLVAGAGLAASSAAGEVGKGAGKAAIDGVAAAFAAVRARLTGTHNLATADRLAEARTDPAAAEAVQAELAAKPWLTADPELTALLTDLRDALARVDPTTAPAYAVDIETIRSARDLDIKDNEGVRAKRAESEGNMTISGNRAPPGNR